MAPIEPSAPVKASELDPFIECCAYPGCNAQTDEPLCILHAQLMSKASSPLPSAVGGTLGQDHRHDHFKKLSATTARKTAQNGVPRRQSHSHEKQSSLPANLSQENDNQRSTLQSTSTNLPPAFDHANKRLKLHGNENQDVRMLHVHSKFELQTNGSNGTQQRDHPAETRGVPLQALSSSLPKGGTAPHLQQTADGRNGTSPIDATIGDRNGNGLAANGTGHGPNGVPQKFRPASWAASRDVGQTLNSIKTQASSEGVHDWFKSTWKKTAPVASQAGSAAHVNGHRPNGIFGIRAKAPKVFATTTGRGIVHFKNLPTPPVIPLRPSVVGRGERIEMVAQRTGLNGHRQPSVSRNDESRPAKRRDERPELERETLDINLDSWIYGQEGALAPPPGVILTPKNELPPPHRDPYYGHIDPRTHWARERSQAWHDKKQQEIKARGSRKANFGKVAERLAQQRRQDEASAKAEAKLLEKVKDNPAWVRALQWAARCEKYGQDEGQDAVQLREQLESDAAGSSNRAAARKRRS